MRFLKKLTTVYETIEMLSNVEGTLSNQMRMSMHKMGFFGSKYIHTPPKFKNTDFKKLDWIFPRYYDLTKNSQGLAVSSVLKFTNAYLKTCTCKVSLI